MPLPRALIAARDVCGEKVRAQQPYSNESINVWDYGYPSGGNYWSDYVGVDAKSGPHQDLLGSDGVGDTLYVIDVNNRHLS